MPGNPTPSSNGVSAVTVQTAGMLSQFFRMQETQTLTPLTTEQDRTNALYSFLTGVDLTEKALENVTEQSFAEALSTVKFKARQSEDTDKVLADMEQQSTWARKLTKQVLDFL